jgi:hypothetical protein
MRQFDPQAKFCVWRMNRRFAPKPRRSRVIVWNAQADIPSEVAGAFT